MSALSILTGNTASGSAIILAILAIGLWALRSGITEHARLNSERALIKKVEAVVRAWLEGHAVHGVSATAPPTAAEGSIQDPDQPPTISDPPEPLGAAPLLDLRLLREGLRPDSLIAERLASIEVLKARRVRIDLHTLQELSLARESARLDVGVPSFVASTAMLLGILGTFVGLSAMVQQIHLHLPDPGAGVSFESWTSSIANLRNILGGMRTAFSTSLVGMLCAIPATALDFWLRRQRLATHEHLERFTAQDLLPATVPLFEDESLLERLSTQMEETYGQLDQVYQDNRHAIVQLSGAHERFREILADVRSFTQTQAAQNVDRILDELEKAGRAILQVTEHLPRLVQAIERGSRETSREIRELAVRSRERTAAVALPRGGLLAILGLALLAVFLLRG